MVGTEDPRLSGEVVDEGERIDQKVVMWSYPVIQDGLIYTVDLRNGLYILKYNGPYSHEVDSVGFLEGNSNQGDALCYEPVPGAPAPDCSAAVETPGGAGGTVPATLSLTLGANASFGAFVPGVAREYTASTTANVISSAGDATLVALRPGPADQRDVLAGPAAAGRALEVDLERSGVQRHGDGLLPAGHRCQRGVAHRRLQQDVDVHAVDNRAVETPQRGSSFTRRTPPLRS